MVSPLWLWQCWSFFVKVSSSLSSVANLYSPFNLQLQDHLFLESFPPDLIPFCRWNWVCPHSPLLMQWHPMPTYLYYKNVPMYCYNWFAFRIESHLSVVLQNMACNRWLMFVKWVNAQVKQFELITYMGLIHFLVTEIFFAMINFPKIKISRWEKQKRIQGKGPRRGTWYTCLGKETWGQWYAWLIFPSRLLGLNDSPPQVISPSCDH